MKKPYIKMFFLEYEQEVYGNVILQKIDNAYVFRRLKAQFFEKCGMIR